MRTTIDLDEQDASLVSRALHRGGGYSLREVGRDALVLWALEELGLDEHSYMVERREEPRAPERLWQSAPILVPLGVSRAWCDSERAAGRPLEGPAQAHRELSAIAALAVHDSTEAAGRDAERWTHGGVELRVVREYLLSEGEDIELAVVVSARRIT